MDAPTIVEVDSSDPALAAELANQVQLDREAASWRRFGTVGFEVYVRWVLNRDTCPVSQLE
jgi:hypothetical protein